MHGEYGGRRGSLQCKEGMESGRGSLLCKEGMESGGVVYYARSIERIAKT